MNVSEKSTRPRESGEGYRSVGAGWLGAEHGACRAADAGQATTRPDRDSGCAPPSSWQGRRILQDSPRMLYEGRGKGGKGCA